MTRFIIRTQSGRLGSFVPIDKLKLTQINTPNLNKNACIGRQSKLVLNEMRQAEESVRLLWMGFKALHSAVNWPLSLRESKTFGL